MTGLPDCNYPAFNAVAARLRGNGAAVENPAENPAPPGGAWLDWMRIAIPQLVECEGVLMLPGWNHSRGARVELQLALGLGLDVSFIAPQGQICGPARRYAP
jgi:hypothetical protein